jgi:hypothetical protein
MLEKKECFLQKKSPAGVEKAKDYTKAKNKNGKCSVENTAFVCKVHLLHIIHRPKTKLKHC